MSLALPPDSHSLCWSCLYCDSGVAITVTRRTGGKDKWHSDWENICKHPADEHVASDDKNQCAGYERDK